MSAEIAEIVHTYTWPQLRCSFVPPQFSLSCNFVSWCSEEQP